MAFVKYIFVFSVETENILEKILNINCSIKHRNYVKVTKGDNDSYGCTNSAGVGGSKASNMYK
jgi:hypothetical protein